VLWSREVVEESDAPMPWRGLGARIARWLEGRTYRERRWVHFTSSKLVADIRAESFGLDAGAFSVAPLPVDPTRFSATKVSRDVRAELGLHPSDFVVITVARLIAWKRIDAIIRAVAGINRRLALLVVGDGPERERLQRLATELDIADRSRFVGWQDPPTYLAAANLFVLPSLVESFGLAYVEAMMMGLPCIGLRYRPPEVLSAASEIIGEGEFGFCVDTDEELRATIEMLAANPARCRTLGERASSVAHARFTPDQYVDRLRTLVVSRKDRVDMEAAGTPATYRL
jgi:glycosyltransferase involved in cell wall biosynthesis